MKQKKKLRALLLGIGITIGMIACSIHKGHSIPMAEGMKQQSPLDEIIQYLIETDAFQYDAEQMEQWEKEMAAGLFQTNNREEEWKAEFLSASILAYHEKFDEAIDGFKQCLEVMGRSKLLKEKARTFYELSRLYLYKEEYEKSSQAVEQMKELYEQEEDKSDLIRLYKWHIYDISDTSIESEKVVELSEELLQIAKESNYGKMEEIYYQLGVTYSIAGRLLEGVNCYVETMRHAELSNNIEYMMYATTEIGAYYMTYNNFTKALEYLKRTVEYDPKDNQIAATQKVYALLNMIECYIGLEQFEEAEQAVKACEKEIKKQSDEDRKADDITYISILKAELLAAKGNGEEALLLVKQVEKEYKKRTYFTYYHFHIKILKSYGDIHYFSGDYKKAIAYHQKAARLLEQQMLYDELYHINERLQKDYEALGDYKNALLYSKKNDELSTVIYEKQEKQYADYLLEKFQREEKMKKIGTLSRSNHWINVLGYILVTILLIVGLSIAHVKKKNREIWRLNQELRELCITDELTNIPNRQAFDEYMSGYWEAEKQRNRPFSCYMLDIDYFKPYNDHYGHPAGDQILQSVAKALQDCCQEGDFLARFGGEEFVMILPDTDQAKAKDRAQEIIEQVRGLQIPHEYSEAADILTLSIGIATTCGQQIEAYEDFINQADMALYEAKKVRNAYKSLDN